MKAARGGASGSSLELPAPLPVAVNPRPTQRNDTTFDGLIEIHSCHFCLHRNASRTTGSGGGVAIHRPATPQAVSSIQSFV